MTQPEFTIKSKVRFDDVGELASDDAANSGFVAYEYHGCNYLVSSGDQNFVVRTYDDEPGTAIVIDPTIVLRLPIVKPLIRFLQRALLVTFVKVYDSQTGTYRSVQAATLKFQS